MIILQNYANLIFHIVIKMIIITDFIWEFVRTNYRLRIKSIIFFFFIAFSVVDIIVVIVV